MIEPPAQAKISSMESLLMANQISKIQPACSNMFTLRAQAV